MKLLDSKASTKQIPSGLQEEYAISTCDHSNIDSKTTSKCKVEIKSKAEVKVVIAQKHKESERRRRMRINAQYATLRTILPNLIKLDKASVLAETIRKVRQLKNSATIYRDQSVVVPDETDTLSLELIDDHHHRKKQDGVATMKATMSCNDRAGLMTEVMKAVRSVKGGKRVLRAEMSTICGRTKAVLWLEVSIGERDHVNDGDAKLLMGLLKKALDKVVYDKK